MSEEKIPPTAYGNAAYSLACTKANEMPKAGIVVQWTKADEIYMPSASMFSRASSKLSKGVVFIVTASTVLYCIYVRSPSWFLAPNQHIIVRESVDAFRYPLARELLSQAAASSVVDHDPQIVDKSASNLHKGSISSADSGEADHASSTVRSAHAQKQNTEFERQQCIPVGGRNSTVRLLGRQLEKCLADSESKPGAMTSNFSLENIYITIKTTQINHKTRILPILLTWLQTVDPEQVINNLI